MVCYNWEVNFQGQQKLIFWFPKININKDNKDNIINICMISKYLKWPEDKNFSRLKKVIFSSRKG